MATPDVMKKMAERQKKVIENLSDVKHKLAILSGKGGVGKSIVTANLAVLTAMRNEGRVGIVDSDFHGPTIPKMLGIEGGELVQGDDGIRPVEGPAGVQVASIAFLSGEETPVIWRGPIKKTMLEQMLSDVDWSGVDYLYFDLPPGTGDEALNIMQVLPDFDGFVVITVPTEVSQSSVIKSVRFAEKLKARVLGVVENMSGFTCPDCGHTEQIFVGNGGQTISEKMGLPLLGEIPLDTRLSLTSDQGSPFVTEFPDSPAAREMERIADQIMESIAD